ncbi:MAG: cytochrome c1 [Gammaproteobacteria bacterium]|nr:MAG: cytochrome c1 [Gammaproteobacteria bacterium]
MRTEAGRGRRGFLAAALLSAAAAATHGAWAAEEAAGGPQAAVGAQVPAAFGADWQSWHAANDVSDMASVQRGARNFVSYCLGCHSLKYERWSRLAQDLGVPPRLLQQDLLPPGDKPAQYILTSMPAADAQDWFGKTPPDLTLMARARGQDYLYQFLRTFYLDSATQTGANNLRLPATAMPHVLSELEGLKRAVYRQAAGTAAAGRATDKPVFDHFEQIAPGRLSAADYDSFVRDTVNFLDYVSEPTQTARRALGVWVVLFLLVFTWLAWLVKREYWKDVH